MEYQPNKPVDVIKNNQEKISIAIRIATPDDWQTVRDLRIEGLNSEDKEMFIGEHPEWLERELNMKEEDWKKELSNKDNFIVLTFAGDQPIGQGSVLKNTNEPGTYGLSRAYIKKEFRKENAGKKQFAYRLKEIIKRGGTRIIHGVWHKNEKMFNLSDSFGFKNMTEEPNQYGFYSRELNDLTNPELLKKIDDILQSE